MLISILAWNYQGIGGKQFILVAKNLIAVHNPTVLVVVEPRISGDQAVKVISGLGFPCSHRIEANGFSSGIWLLWRDDQLDIEILLNRKQLMHTRISLNGRKFLFTGIYASSNQTIRERL